MNRERRFFRMVSAFALSWAFAPFVQACTACFSGTGPETRKALIAAVLFLVGVVGMVLGAIACCAWVWARRARRLARQGAREGRDFTSVPASS